MLNIPITPEQESSIIGRERLRLLSLAYYISGGMGAFFSCFLLIYVIMFGAISFIPEKEWSTLQQPASTQTSSVSKIDPVPNSAPPVIVFRIVAGVMAFFVLCGWTLAGLTVYAGRCLQKRKGKIFIYIMAGLNLIWIPYGTLLGIATIFVLNSEAAKREFEAANAPVIL